MTSFRLKDIKLGLDHTDQQLLEKICAMLEVMTTDLHDFSVFKRSYDARKKSNIQLVYQIDAVLNEGATQTWLDKIAVNTNAELSARISPDTQYHLPHKASDDFPVGDEQRPVVIGFGPCGILAALLLAQMGLKPIVLERGQDVRQRTKDTWGLWREGKLNPESNVQFGEGGAGTFSDGKLYSQVKDKRFLGRKVLDEFVKAGAPEEILTISKPHIGTFKLVKMVETMRAEIVRLGGDIRFGEKVETLIRTGGQDDSTLGQITGLILASGERIDTQHVVLAVGHSARDTFQMLLEQGVYIEPKPFSIGFRIEHPQSIIDKARFGKQAGHPLLGAADYKLVHHCSNGRSVYSFCMCPGGTVVAAASEPGQVVTNGMSQYSRNERNANAAIVVGIDPETDYPEHVLAGIDLQRELEQRAYKLGGENYQAPAQCVGDFLAGKPAVQLGSVNASYTPGVRPTDLSLALPEFAIDAIKEAILAFDKKIPGFAMDDAVLTAVETRTSSPICIKRGKDGQSLNTLGLYPAGEGAGYAGGILSAGIDGIKMAEAVGANMLGAK